MNTDKTLSVLNYIFCFILAVSVFLIWIPLDDGGCLGLATAFIQIFIIFYFHKVLKYKKPYYFFTSLLALSNVVNCVIYYFYIQSYISEFNNMNITATGSPVDSLWISMVPALYKMVFAGVLTVTVIVVVECAISMAFKYRCSKNLQLTQETNKI